MEQFSPDLASLLFSVHCRAAKPTDADRDLAVAQIISVLSGACLTVELSAVSGTITAVHCGAVMSEAEMRSAFCSKPTTGPGFFATLAVADSVKVVSYNNGKRTSWSTAPECVSSYVIETADEPEAKCNCTRVELRLRPASRVLLDPETTKASLARVAPGVNVKVVEIRPLSIDSRTKAAERLLLDGESLTIEDLIRASYHQETRIEVSAACMTKVGKARDLADKFTEEGRVIYGVTTSAGGLANHLLPKDQIGDFQANLLRTVATQVGDPFPDYVVRTAMIIRVNSLARGFSGVAPKNLEILVEMINKGVYPVVKEKGSLGTSGDLGPLAMIALAGIGEWKARYQGVEYPAAEAMRRAGIPLMKLASKEGLSLCNATSFQSAVACHAVSEAAISLRTATVISALTLEALKGFPNPFYPNVQRQRYHPGQYAAARNFLVLLKDSKLTSDEVKVSARLQVLAEAAHRGKVVVEKGEETENAYSLRCMPQYFGPIYETLENARATLQREINTSNDNPILFAENGTFAHCGHFHGHVVSTQMDFLSIAMTGVGVISDRKIDRMLDKSNSYGLPPFLCEDGAGVRMGLMGGQFMTASLVAENRTKNCVPASIQSISTTAGFQDIVSFGLIAARKARDCVKNVNYCTAFEALCAAQAADIRGKDLLSPVGKAVYDCLRKITPFNDHDRMIVDDLENIASAIADGSILETAENVSGKALWLYDYSKGMDQ